MSDIPEKGEIFRQRVPEDDAKQEKCVIFVVLPPLENSRGLGVPRAMGNTARLTAF